MPAPAGIVRVTLTDAGTVAVGSVLGPRASMLEGRWVARTDSTLVLGVTQVRRIDGSEQTMNGDQVTLGQSSVQEVGVVRPAVARSILLGSAIVATAVIVAISVGRGSGVGGGRGGGGQRPAQ